MRSKRKRGGPWSAAGKAIASRNALRHGFSANLHRRSPAPERIERLARVISGDDSDPAVVAVAYKIAENQLILSEIAAHKVWVVERLREPYANPFSSKDNALQLAIARLMEVWLAEREIGTRVPALLAKYELRLTVEALSKSRDDYIAFLERDLAVFHPDASERAAVIEQLDKSWVESQAAQMKAQGWRISADDIVPVRLKALLEEPEESETSARTDRACEIVLDQPEERDECEALEAAVLDLIRLERYEQRVWSRQKRAILQLTKIKLERRFGHMQTVPA